MTVPFHPGFLNKPPGYRGGGGGGGNDSCLGQLGCLALIVIVFVLMVAHC